MIVSVPGLCLFRVESVPACLGSVFPRLNVGFKLAAVEVSVVRYDSTELLGLRDAPGGC